MIIFSGHFRKYDYGFLKNLIKYGTLTPPDYKLENIVAPMALYYSKNDAMSGALVSITIWTFPCTYYIVSNLVLCNRMWRNCIKDFRMSSNCIWWKMTNSLTLTTWQPLMLMNYCTTDFLHCLNNIKWQCGFVLFLWYHWA